MPLEPFWWLPSTDVLYVLPLLNPRTANDKISCEANQLFTDPIWGVVMSLGRLLISLLMAQWDLELGYNEPAPSWAGIDMLILSLMGYFHSLVNSTPGHNYGCLSDTWEDKGREMWLGSLEDWKGIALLSHSIGSSNIRTQDANKALCFHGWMGKRWGNCVITCVTVPCSYCLCHSPSNDLEILAALGAAWPNETLRL